MTCVIRDKSGNIINQSRNLAGIRRYVGKHTVQILDICPIGNGEGQLSILFENGDSFQTNFASYTVLKNFVRNWRNAYGAPLTIGGVESGEVSYQNPTLV